jgi:hypothetical protein
MDPVEPLEPKRPLTIAVASCIWIALGVELATAAICLFLLGMTERDPLAGDARISFEAIISYVLAAVAAGLLYVGFRTWEGRARNTLWSGFGCVILALLIISLIIQLFLRGHGVGFLVSLEVAFLLAAGILALIGRRKYKAWREARKAYQAATSDGTMPPA